MVSSGPPETVVLRACNDVNGFGARALLAGAAQKLAAFPLKVADRDGKGGMIDRMMSRQDIADYPSFTIETASRTLSNWSEMA